MSWTKSILTVACCYFSSVACAQTERFPVITSLYPMCPLSFQLENQSYALDVEYVYAGDIEDAGALKPEPVPDEDNVEPSFWDYGEASPERPFHIKCLYKDTGHYLVLKLKGARRCTFTKGSRTQCE